MRLAAALLIVASLTACTTTNTASSERLYHATLTSAQKTAIKGEMLQYLKDPYSARFGDILAMRQRDGLIHICVWINAKNSFGAYTGYRPSYLLWQGSGKFRHRTSITGDDLETRVVCSHMREYYNT